MAQTVARRHAIPRAFLFGRSAALGLAAVVVGGSALWFTLGRSVAPEQLLADAQDAQRQGDLTKAEELAVRAWEEDPRLNAAALLAGECAAARQDWSRALERFGRIESNDAALLLSLRLKRAEILLTRLHRLGDAERAYRTALEIAPDHVAANTALAQLLSRCGRMREVTPHVLRVIRQGQEPDLMLLLVRGEVAIEDRDLLMQARQADPSDPNPLIGLAWHALQEERHAECEDLLRSALRIQPDNVPALILLGRLLLATNRTEEFAEWAAQWPPAARDVADAWLVRGQMAEAIEDGPGAIRCYWESVRLGPYSKTATFRLAHELAEAGEARAAEAFRDRVQRLNELEEVQNRVLYSADRGRPEQLLPLARSYEAAGRLWEAWGWSQFAIEVGMTSQELAAYVDHLRSRLKDEPLQLVTDSANVALAFDLSRFPVPDLSRDSTPAPSAVAATSSAPVFRDDAQAVGLAFQYFNGVNGPPTHRMFEFTGGGIGVLDFDLDAWPDLFLTQGRAWPPGSPDASGGDRLFRNRGGAAFHDVTAHAGIEEDGFGQGVTIGDFDADGFPDVYVANIGRNQLWLNLGDGTFRDVTAAAELISDDWTTSPVMVDLTGDGLPDIYDVNYVTAEDVFERVCHHTDGSPKLCMPHDFYGRPDRLWLNLGDGRFREGTTEVLGEQPLGMGLGVAVWDAEGTGRLSLFVANDTTRCFYFRPEMFNGTVRLRECGIETGLAFNGSGKATGCMGVALGDVNDDGRMDLHITNFYAEPNTLFLSSAPGSFEDQTRQTGLEAPSFSMLGFGTQFLDADLDGRLELFVANGHVDDLSRLNRPYRMPPQLFRWDGRGRFAELSPDQLGSYFMQNWLGRPAARLDWNRDGRDDLTIGHLYDPIALLTNTTRDMGGHLALRLFGVESPRDAIGTTVRARIGSRTIVRQLTAGDGYQCGNERKLIVGTGDADAIDELQVRWPSGREQRFADVAVRRELWLREGREPVPSP
jgi:thioredoxin-like negative regulator of GroEL